jgi:putative ABC transport system permease protein
VNTGFFWIQKALLSHYWRHPWQALFLSVGLISGVALWSAVQIINQQAESSYRDAQYLLGAQASYWVRDRDGKGIEPALYIELRRQGFRQIYPVIELEVSTPSGTSISVIATDLIAVPGNVFADLGTDGDAVDSWLKFTQAPYQSWIPEALAAELNLSPGDQLLLRDGRKLPPASIQARKQQGRRVLIDIAAAFSLSGNQRFTYLVAATLRPDEYQQLLKILPAHLQLVENQQHIDLTTLTASLHTHLTAMSLLSFAVGLFIVFNAVRFSLWYRRRTLLDLRLMGCQSKQLAAAIVVETVIWSLLGSGLGFLFGIVLASGLLPGMGASLHSLYQASIESSLQLEFKTLLQAWSITFIGLIWALAWPLFQQLRLSTLVAASSDFVADNEIRLRRRLALGAAVLSIAAWLYYPQIASAEEGFILLGMILFAAAWWLPMLLAAVLRLLEWVVPGKWLITRWMVSDSWSQLPAFRSAMMALLLALTANIGVGTLVDSFRNAFTGWLDLRQSADIYLRAPDLDYQRLVEDGYSASWLQASHQRIGVTTRWQNRPALIRGADTSAPDSLVMPLSKWQGASADIALRRWRYDPGTVLINEQLHFLAGVGVGEQVEIETDKGLQNYEVVGVFYDYGNPYFQFYLSDAVVRANWRHYYSRGIALWLNKENTMAMEAAEQGLESIGAQPGDWISQAQIRKLSVGIFDRTFAITAAMNGLTLIIAAIALMASLLAILQERIPQFAQWRALGLRQSEQMLLVAVPLIIFCTTVWLLAIPLGGLLSWVLINKLNIISFGWSMPMQWQLAPALKLVGVVGGVVALALLFVSIQWRRQMTTALASLGETV